MCKSSFGWDIVIDVRCVDEVKGYYIDLNYFVYNQSCSSIAYLSVLNLCLIKLIRNHENQVHLQPRTQLHCPTSG